MLFKRAYKVKVQIYSLLSINNIYEELKSWVSPRSRAEPKFCGPIPRSWADFISEFPDCGPIHVKVIKLVSFYIKRIFIYMALIKTAFTFQPASRC